MTIKYHSWDLCLTPINISINKHNYMKIVNESTVCASKMQSQHDCPILNPRLSNLIRRRLHA